MNSILPRANTAIADNPLVANIDLSVHGSDFLWAVFAVMALSAIVLAFMGSRRPVGQRAFHNLAAVICFTASIAYFAMASDLGGTPVRVEFIRGGTLGANWVKLGVDHPTRSIWYARYIDWVITTPLLLLELLLATGMPLSDIFMTIFMDEVMIITGLIGALVASEYKFGFFAFGCAAEIYIWWILLGPARTSAGRLGPDFHKSYVGSAAVLSFLWLGYPICWGLSEGGNVITPTSEFVFYGVLDVLAKPVFCFYHIWSISKVDYNRLAFSSGKVSDGTFNTDHNVVAHENPRYSTSTAVDENGNPHGAKKVVQPSAGTTPLNGDLHSAA